MQVIVYNQDDGRIALIRPTENALTRYGINAIALKDVPYGKSFKIIDAANVPIDPSEREAWSVDDSDMTDGVGADYGSGSNWLVMALSADGIPTRLVHQITGEIIVVADS